MFCKPEQTMFSITHVIWLVWQELWVLDIQGQNETTEQVVSWTEGAKSIVSNICLSPFFSPSATWVSDYIRTVHLISVLCFFFSRRGNNGPLACCLFSWNSQNPFQIWLKFSNRTESRIPACTHTSRMSDQTRLWISVGDQTKILPLTETSLIFYSRNWGSKDCNRQKFQMQKMNGKYQLSSKHSPLVCKPNIMGMKMMLRMNVPPHSTHKSDCATQ